MKTWSTAAVLLLAAACAAAPRAPAGPAPVEPVGRYEFTTLFQGQPISGTLEVTGTPGSYRGSIVSAAIPELPVTAVEVEGREMRVSADTPDGPLSMRMTFTGDDFTGSWELAGQGGELAGRRLP